MTTATKPMTKKQQAAQDVQHAREQLLKLCPVGTTVYTVLRHVSASGMSRRIDLYTISDGELVFLSGYVSRVLDYKRHPSKQGLTVGGCGMDLGYHMVDSLSWALHGSGYQLKHDWI